MSKLKEEIKEREEIHEEYSLPAAGSDSDNEPVTVIAIGIKPSTSKQDLELHFSKFGRVDAVETTTDESTGEVIHVGVVTYHTLTDAEKCIRERSHVINGTKVDVQVWQDEEEEYEEDDFE